MVGNVEAVERRPVQLFRFHRIDDLGKVAGKPDGIGRACGGDEWAFGMYGGHSGGQAVAPGEHEAGKLDEARRAGQRFGHVEKCGRHLVEEAAVVIGLAQCPDDRQDRRFAAEEIDEFRAQHAGRTPGRHIDGDVGQRQRIGRIIGEAGHEAAVDEACRHRFQERQARRDRKDAAAARAGHAAAS